jgi:hypothetical protein
MKCKFPQCAPANLEITCLLEIGLFSRKSRLRCGSQLIWCALAEQTLPRANLARVEPNRSGSLSRSKGISLCCALSVETVFWRSGVSLAASFNSRTRLPRFDAGHEHGKQPNEFAAHEQQRAAASRNRYPACSAEYSITGRKAVRSNSAARGHLSNHFKPRSKLRIKGVPTIPEWAFVTEEKINLGSKFLKS